MGGTGRKLLGKGNFMAPERLLGLQEKRAKCFWRPVKSQAVLYTDRHIAKLLPAAI